MIFFFYGFISIFLATVSYLLKKVSLSGAIAGGTISFLLLCNHWVNFILFGLFFVLGTLATKWKFEQKQQLKLEQENNGIRNWIHAFSNGGVPAICSLLVILFPKLEILTFAATAAIAAALSDTLSSEFGNVYGKKYIDILSFSKGKRGDDGVISLEGTLVGLVGSALIATVCGILINDYSVIFPISIAGFAGNIIDSYLGATLQRKGWINNHFVNFINTAFAAFIFIFWEIY